MIIKFKKLSSMAKAPERAHRSDAGYDLFALEAGTINGRCAKAFRTGIAVEIPEGYYGEIHSRSSWFKDNFDADGVIDSGYRGEIMIMLHNHTFIDKAIRAGEKIAQIIFIKLPDTELVEVDELSDSDRGTGGFGSTGR